MAGTIFMISLCYVPDQQDLCPNYCGFCQGHLYITSRGFGGQWLWVPRIVTNRKKFLNSNYLQGTARSNRPRSSFYKKTYELIIIAVA